MIENKGFARQNVSLGSKERKYAHNVCVFNKEEIL